MAPTFLYLTIAWDFYLKVYISSEWPVQHHKSTYLLISSQLSFEMWHQYLTFSWIHTPEMRSYNNLLSKDKNSAPLHDTPSKDFPPSLLFPQCFYLMIGSARSSTVTCAMKTEQVALHCVALYCTVLFYSALSYQEERALEHLHITALARQGKFTVWLWY